MKNECIVAGCTNRKEQGTFVGDICAPCYEMIVSGEAHMPSTNFIHVLFKRYEFFRDAVIRRKEAEENEK